MIKLRASTMVETLVMMLVVGIIFLSVMDGLRMFTKMQAQRAETIIRSGREAMGYQRVAMLAASTDSVVSYRGDIEFYRQGRRSLLSLRDASLVYVAEEFSDTLIWAVGAIHLRQYDSMADTIEIEFATGFVSKFCISKRLQMQHDKTVDKLENEYVYLPK